MKESRDFAIVFHINEHYRDLKEDIESINNFEIFINAKEKRRAILFDFMQIGELTNQLSKCFLKDFNNENAVKLISIRNRIVHGYSTIRDDLIFSTIKNDIPCYINELNAFAYQRYRLFLNNLLGKKIKIIIDRSIGFNHGGIIYSLNYGYYEGLTALDGKYQDAYIIDESNKIKECYGKVIAIVHRENDIEDKLVVSSKGSNFDKDEIEKMVEFQEQYFRHTIIK